MEEDPWHMPVEKYIKLTFKEREEVQQRALKLHEEEIRRLWKELDEAGLFYAIVCDGRVIERGHKEDYPSKEKIKEIAEKYGKLPFVYREPPIIEESSELVGPAEMEIEV